ncbi:Sec-independent protein translocase subunit TatA [Jatrophihabitans sp. DSM 45814]
MFGAGMERPTTWAIIAIAALVLFGYKKLPDMSRSVGRSLRIFKTEMKGLTDDDAARDSAATPAASQAAAPVVPAAPEAAPQPPAAAQPPVVIPPVVTPVVAAEPVAEVNPQTNTKAS